MKEMPRQPAQLVLALIAAMLGAVMVAIYVRILVGQGDTWLAAVPFILVLGIGAGTALTAAIRPGNRRRLLAITAGIFLVVGLLGIMTIGILFMIVAVVAGLGALWPPQTELT